MEIRLKLLKKADQEVDRKMKNLCMPICHMNQSQLVENYVDFVTVEGPKRTRRYTEESD